MGLQVGISQARGRVRAFKHSYCKMEQSVPDHEHKKA